MNRMSIGALLVVALTAAGVRAQTAPAAQDLSTPRAAIKSFYQALEDGNFERAKKAAIADKPQLEYIQGFVDLCQAMTQLGEAADEKFGADGAKLHFPLPVAQLAALADSAAIEEQGDTATCAINPKVPMTLKRSDGVWRVDLVTSFAGNVDKLQVQSTFQSQFAAAIKEVVGEIKAGKLASVVEARTALQAKLKTIKKPGQ